MSRICIVGAGAIGGHVAARLIAEGRNQVSVIARGPHLAAIRSTGLWLQSEGALIGGHPVAASDSAADLSAQDLVIVAVKSHGLTALADQIAALARNGAPVVFLVNGIPWWWQHGLPDPVATERVDPGRRIWNRLGPDCAIGAVVYSSNRMLRPGVIEHVNANRWILGEPLGPISDRLRAVGEVFTHAGLAAETVPDIRRSIWEKLLLNAALNAPAALTRLPLPDLFEVPGIPELVANLVAEIAEVARASGYPIAEPARLAVTVTARSPGRVYPSMLQDVLASRPIEVDALLAQVDDFAQTYGVSCPTLGNLLGLTQGLKKGSVLAHPSVA